MTISAGQDGPLAVLTTRTRLEERLIFEALERRGVPYEQIDERRVIGDLGAPVAGRYRGVLNRSMSHTRSLYAARLFEAGNLPVFNPSAVIETCGDKILTSLALAGAGIPTPVTVVALTPDAALEAIERVGYPAVVKPAVGSWGRLLAKVNDRDAAEALIEHKQSLRSPVHSVFYVQEYIDKPGRDLRVIVLGDEVVAAVYRRSGHWITNTARGASTERCPLTDDLVKLSLRAAQAVGGGMLAVDLIERATGELLVTEVNHTMEFHGLSQATEVDLADLVVGHVLGALAP
ncbi:lysine biosynthesis protein LysX [Microbispora tritici]|uniref:Lysine biosynthesis protein LysX n=1 Tax=Microbispora tritici TaxID=2604471 RepID=A0ABY3M2X3_9ACTN|nr:lysine biosynthesis protein LysX [Microbispora tritici]TYB65092.1 lysine biosynthesis protein LysX [Microbispora tritici]